MSTVHSKTKMLEVINNLKKCVLGIESDIYYALESANALYGDSISGISESVQLSIAYPNTVEKYSNVIIDILENYIQSNSIFGFDFSRIDSGDSELDKLILDSIKYFKENKKDTACEKIWDALERIKSYSYRSDIKPDDNDKKNSAEKLISKIARDDQNYIEFFDEECTRLTYIGNTFRIRHHEKNKINIDFEERYDYFFSRCLTFIKLCLTRLDGDE